MKNTAILNQLLYKYKHETFYLFLQLANPDSTGLKPNKDERNQLNITNNLRVIPGTISNVEIGVKYLFDTPVYWQLPKRFCGDKVGIHKY